MRRALAEYEIRGVRSTLAFARWLLARPEFVEARFHTGYLDELLQQRSGKSFGDPDPSLEEVAALAACLAEATKETAALQTGVMSSSTREYPQVARSGRSWKGRARRESLRE
jgi:acetyl/propionyl-CoA carboxylase alpha subunit